MSEIKTAILFNRKFLSSLLKVGYGSLCRPLYKPVESSPNIKNDEEPNVRQQEKLSQIPKQARMKLQSVLGIREIDTMKMLLSDEKLLTTSLEKMNINKKLCEENRISTSTLMKYPFLLYDCNLNEKIETLKQLPFELECSIPLARLSLHAFNIITQNAQCVQRIHYISKLFNIGIELTCDIIARRTFMYTKPLEELQALLKILHGDAIVDSNIFFGTKFAFTAEGFPNEEILNDLWVLKYSESFLKSRMELIQKTDIKKLKTWMIRCPEEVLYKHIKRETDNRDILGENSVVQYLSQQLCCNENLAQNLIIRQPQLKTKSLSKITNMINLLYRHGYKPAQICKVPKILLHSYKTTEVRLKQLTALGEKPDSLYVLTKSQKKYQLHIENLVKSNNNNSTE